ncbi:phosphatase PAP2 family protein [Vibrio sp. SCSIO 43137]|uniref:phosphatase PAP2 family protein n=1 Tax=Vibrio sp. SCSIO 43137 TaxID=3021011 RepID=UPI0023079AC4|nr:phosphatase PAP2 family protein [Vibrio sp. SCSIO 43137]WCE30257.1 phosphatase PAP2 family protein [Vibrio sp. SCSIO 43137]
MNSIKASLITYRPQRYFLIALTCLLICLLLLQLFAPPVDYQTPLSDLPGFILTSFSLMAGKPLFPVTIFAGFGFAYLVKSRQNWGITSVQFILLLCIAFVCKSAIKMVTEEPRPYTAWLTESGIVESPASFYQLDELNKLKLIRQSENIFGFWRTENWKDGTNYALPSGHTIFAALFVAFWGGLLLQYRYYLLTSLVVLWGVAVAGSRLYLGMHSYADLYTSISLIYLFSVILPLSHRLISRLAPAHLSG